MNLPDSRGVVFLCGGLAPGRDGVGDFTRALSKQLRDAGELTSMVAWRDEHVRGKVEELQENLPTVRYGTDFTGERKVTGPDTRWVSLQFVPFSFDRKGLASRSVDQLMQAASGARWHVMVHEPWSDGGRGGRLRRLAVSTLQRLSTRLIFRKLRPACVHTSNLRYAELLRGIGVEASLLPIFGAIPLVGRRDDTAFRAQFREIQPIQDAQLHLRIGVFGTLHEEWHPKRELEDLRRAAALAGRRLELVGVGGWGVAGEQVWRRLESLLGVTGVHLGRREAAEVSTVLANLDIALTSTPWEIVEKSSAVAAMLEHGAPVVVTRGDGKGRMREGIHFSDGNWGARWIEVAALRRPNYSGAAQVARKFREEVLGNA